MNPPLRRLSSLVASAAANSDSFPTGLPDALSSRRSRLQARMNPSMRVGFDNSFPRSLGRARPFLSMQTFPLFLQEPLSSVVEQRMAATVRISLSKV